MKKAQQIKSLKQLLERALAVACQSNHHTVIEARSHIRAAMRLLSKAQKMQERKDIAQQTQYGEWWDQVSAGTAEGFHSPESYTKSLAQIEAMLQHERDKLDQLEKEASTPQQRITAVDLLND